MATTYAIPNGRTVMDATTYTGNGGTITVNNSDNGTTGFKPDLVWCKDRTSALNNILLNSVTGGTQYLISNSSSAEGNGGSTTINSFNTNGFTAGNGTALNTNGDNFVAWQWQAGQGTTSSNTSGTITTTTSVNATAGFSIVSYTSNATAGSTIGHGLGVAPSLVIARLRNQTASWAIYHVSLGASQWLVLNGSNAVISSTQEWGGVAPTSSVVTIGNSSANNNALAGSTAIAYCWAPVAGFSQFGSYTGNGSSDGPFVYTGFRPKFVLFKKSNDVADWNIRDTARSPNNVVGEALYPNLTFAEYSGTETYVDILSNGFKLRGNWNSSNASGGTYIYAAFAENPFKYANAR
jgi:hypothetical protein